MLSPRPTPAAPRSASARRAAVASLGVIALLATTAPALAQDPGTPQLSISKILFEAPVAGSTAGTMKVTVANATGRAATPSDRPVVVKIVLVNPNGRSTTYETSIRGSIPGGGAQTGVISAPAIYMREVGTHTVTAWATLSAGNGATALRSPDKIEKILVSGPPR